MTDVIFVLALIVAFALLAGFLRLCERIIGPDPEGVVLASGPELGGPDAADTTEVAA